MARTQAKDHGEKRRHILKGAAEVFAREGFARASMNQLATACGISKANIYHYYDSKDALLFDILDSYLSELRDRVCGLDLAGIPPEAQLGAVVRETLLAYDGMDHEHQIQSEGIPLLPPDQQQVLRGYQRELVALFGEILDRVAPHAFVGDKGKRRAAVMSVFGMLNWFYMWNPRADRAEREAYAAQITQMVLRGVSGL